MLKIQGTVVNSFSQEAGTNKDGQEYPISHKVQLMGEMLRSNGDIQMDLVDLKVDSLSDWEDLKGKTISIDIGEFAPSKGHIIHFVRKGAKPVII